MDIIDYAFSRLILQNQTLANGISSQHPYKNQQKARHNFKHLDFFFPLRQLLDQIEINNPRIAKFICQLIPAQCPFHRNISVFGHVIVTIPPLCKLNPLYDNLMMLRFRCLCYLETVN